jgi:hypothetical protein
MSPACRANSARISPLPVPYSNDDQKHGDLFLERQVCHLCHFNQGRETDTLAHWRVHSINSRYVDIRKLVDLLRADSISGNRP